MSFGDNHGAVPMYGPEPTYIVSPPPRRVPVDLLPADDPDAVAYNECKVALHLMEETTAKMRHHLSLIEQRINDRVAGMTKQDITHE